MDGAEGLINVVVFLPLNNNNKDGGLFTNTQHIIGVTAGMDSVQGGGEGCWQGLRRHLP